MVGRGQRGPDPQWGKRGEWARLIALGVSNSDACRIVGVNRRPESGGDTGGQSGAGGGSDTTIHP